MKTELADRLMARKEQYRWITAPSPRGAKMVEALLVGHDGKNATVVGDYNGPKRSPLKSRWVVALDAINYR